MELLETHLADLNTQLALNTMALAAFGLTPPHGLAAVGPAGQDEEDR